MPCYSVTAIDFDPPTTELIDAETAGKARMRMARRAHDAGWYETLFDACRRMRAVRVREERDAARGGA